ncbi:MAG: ribonuclease D [Gammaproteobacteria bacterium]|nr:ribonuclease D [Gammaproteobacteria bacterium]
MRASAKIDEKRCMNYLIEDQDQLKEIEPLFKELGERGGEVAVDTEFFREKTYRAKLCLMQLGIDGDQYCVDVLAIDDLQPLKDLLVDERVLKLFHAARQDMEVILQTLEVMPKPIFDTQLAAAFGGLDMQIGYSALVQDRLDIELPKSQARTDWTRRPLSTEQVQYAADDVAHLAQLRELALQDLNDNGKFDWFEQELADYYDASKYLLEPALAFQRLSGGGLKIKQQYALKALAEWREAQAQKRDIPRSWVLKDDALFDLACRMPRTDEEALSLGVFGRKSGRYLAPQAVQIINELEVGDEVIWTKVDPLTKQQKKTVSNLMRKLSELAKQHHVAQGLLGTRKDVEGLYRHGQSEKLLEGWRAEIVGQPLLKALEAEQA